MIKRNQNLAKTGSVNVKLTGYNMTINLPNSQASVKESAIGDAKLKRPHPALRQNITSAISPMIFDLVREQNKQLLKQGLKYK